MALVNCHEFKEVCLDQGVRLCPSLANCILEDQSGLLFETVSPVMAHDWELSAGPIIDGPLELPEPMQQDTTARLYAALAKQPRIDSNEESMPSFFGAREPAFAVGCALAEERFMEAIEALGQVSESGHITKNGSNIVMFGGHPVIIQKSNVLGETSGLALTDVVVDEVRYPAGSLFSMELFSDKDGYCYLFPPSSYEVQLCAKSLVRNIRFRRLTHFALDPDERAELVEAGSRIMVSDERKDRYMHLKISELKSEVEAAVAKIQASGIEIVQ